MDRYLVIVSRDRPELVQELRSTYGQSEEVEILLDRRQTPRRTLSRNDADRRSTLRLDAEVEGHGFFVTPQLQGLVYSF
jgi:hypothetical protein